MGYFSKTLCYRNIKNRRIRRHGGILLCFLLLDESGDGEHILADLSTELGCAFHDKLALLRGVKHIVKTEQDAKRAVERIEAESEERHSSLVNASAGSRFARLYAQISRKLIVAVDSPRMTRSGLLSAQS